MLKTFAQASLASFLLLASVSPGLAQDASTPTGAVNSFHQALRIGDTSTALSLLSRDLVVYEFGVIDPTVEAYTFQHLPIDMDMAAATAWSLENRQVGGQGDTRWVLSAYHVTGVDVNGQDIDHRVLETVLLTRIADAFRIAHLHWSNDDPDYMASLQGLREDATANAGADGAPPPSDEPGPADERD